jgi:hypothetical protein
LESFKTELEDGLRNTLANIKFELTPALREIPEFNKLPYKLEYYDELLTLKTRLTDLLLRLKAGTLIKKEDLRCSINPAFVQLSNFHEIASHTNELSYSLQYHQTGLHYITILEAVEARISDIKSTLINPAESLAIFRDFRRRTTNQKLNAIFHKLRIDAQRNSDIGDSANSLMQEDSSAQNNSVSNNDTVPKSARMSTTNRHHRSRNQNRLRNRSLSGARSSSLTLNRDAHTNSATLGQQSRVYTNKTWINRTSGSVQTNRIGSAGQSNRPNQFGSRSNNNITISNNTARSNHYSRPNRTNNNSFRNYADDWPIESDSDEGPMQYYSGPKPFYRARK